LRAVTSVVAHSDVVQEVSVTLLGTRSEGVGVFDTNGRQLAHSNDDKKGFIDVIWVAVTRARLVQDVPSDAPVRVVRRENGNIGILDDTTGWKIELIGYGKDNVAAFAKLFEELSAHVKFNNGAVVHPGDSVQVEGPEILAAYGELVEEERIATITRASKLEQLWTRATGDFEFISFSEEVLS